MKAEWRTVKVGDICKINADSYSPKENWPFVNYLDTGNITRNRIDCVQYIDMDNEKLPSRAKRKLRKNSIVYSMVRPNQCHYGIIKTQPKNFLVSTGFAVIDANERLVDADFLYYALSRNEVIESLHAIAEQSISAYPSIKPSDLEDLDILLPPLEEQRKISCILKAIDDKIALNNRINENLEQQARTIFKAWFSGKLDVSEYNL